MVKFSKKTFYKSFLMLYYLRGIESKDLDEIWVGFDQVLTKLRINLYRIFS